MSAAAGQGVKWARAFALSMAICMAMGPTCIPFAWSASMFAVVEVSRTTLMSGLALYWPLAASPRRSVSRWVGEEGQQPGRTSCSARRTA